MGVGMSTLPDDQAKIFTEAALGLARAAVALPLDALNAWINVERTAVWTGQHGVTGAHPRQLDQLMLIVVCCQELANRARAFDYLMAELEDEAQAAPAPPPAEETPKAPEPFGDRRDEPVPDDWAV